MLSQTCMTFFLLWITKDDILKNGGNQTVSVTNWLLLYGRKKIKFTEASQMRVQNDMRVNYARIYIFG